MTNDFVICSDVTEIILPRRNGERLVTLIDTADLDRVSRYPGGFYLLPRTPRRLYAVGEERRNGVRIPHRTRLHRLVMDAPPGFDVDHANHDGLDNRKSNLRVVTRSRNMLNRRGNDANNSTGYRGVYWIGSKGKYRAVIVVEGKSRQLGHYDCRYEAARIVRDELAVIDPVAASNYPPIPEAAGAA